MAILFLLPLLVHLVAGTMVPQEGGKMGIELVTIHGLCGETVAYQRNRNETRKLT